MNSTIHTTVLLTINSTLTTNFTIYPTTPPPLQAATSGGVLLIHALVIGVNALVRSE